MFSGLYSNASGFVDTTPIFDNWAVGPSDPLQNKAGTLVAFCFPNPSMLAPGSNEARSHDALKGLLTAENLKHFLGEYKNYNSHWPMIHMPSFNPADANDGLVLAMVCIGAVYSDRLGVKEVRWLMELVRASILRSSQVYKLVIRNAHDVVGVSENSSQDIQEVQALVLLHSLFVWHGTQKQRQQARDDFGTLAEIARYVELLNPIPVGYPGSSSLHQPGHLDENDINAWTWDSWIEQETRGRVMYLIFLIDASLVMFFNVQSQFDIYEIKLPLPADDAAWEARTQEDCACALGLRGEIAQMEKNISGSRHLKQLGMSEALRFLHRGGEFPQRSTNVYAKFILIHAIHVQVSMIQRQTHGLGSLPNYGAFSSSGASTPLSQSERTSMDGTASNGNSGRATPTDVHYLQSHQMLRATVGALELWKKAWDLDMPVQYPPNQPRVGFCRDGVHFYFLAMIFLRSTRHEDWVALPDTRCQQVFNLLKQVRTHVASDSVQKGIDFGSVTYVNDSYNRVTDDEVADLTLNMKLLFTPLSQSSH